MSTHLELYSKSNDLDLFRSEFLGFSNELYKDKPHIMKLPEFLESFYFKMYPGKHDFILIKDNNDILLRSMICVTSFEDTAFFGLFDFNQHSKLHAEALEHFKRFLILWLSENQLKRIIGPINFSTWLPYRLMSSMDGGPLYSFEPNRPTDYCSRLKNIGFKSNQIYSSKCYKELKKFTELTKNQFDSALNAGFKFESMPKCLSESDISTIHQLSLRYFEKSYLATSIDFRTFSTLYAANSGKDDYSNSFFVLSPTGEKIGFLISFYEHNSVVIKTVGINDEYRGYGLSNACIYLSLIKAQELGIDLMVAAMVKEGAQSESYGRKMTLQWTHLYEILEFNLNV